MVGQAQDQVQGVGRRDWFFAEQKVIPAGSVPEDHSWERADGIWLMPESTDHIEHQGKHGAEQNRGCEWEIKGRVFAAVEDIPGKAAYRKAGASKEQEKRPYHEQKHPKEDENFAELGHLISKSSMIGS